MHDEQRPADPKHPILLVDDEPEILFSLRALLRREFEVHTAESGPEALEILEQHTIHVVMTDQRMPGMTGVELMGRVKSRFPEAIRIVFTGYADIKAVVDAINKGGLYRYITKPWDPDELIATLHEAAEEYVRLVEQRQLLGDLKEYVARACELADRLEASAESQRLDSDLNQFRQSGNRLLERLDQLFRTQPGSRP